ncbi:MAG: hypothetical protein ACJAT2_002703 [Bacteriovoracaceae bacterium]|jgi:hypothetical protein
MSLFAQEKIAITMGADHEGGLEFVKEQNAHANKALKESGYKVSSFFGDQEKAKSYSKKIGAYASPFTLKNVQKKLEQIYSKPCSERPEKLMLNFVAHGSRNGKDARTGKPVPRHSVNGVKKNADGSFKKQRIYADQFAKIIKNQQAKDPGCEKPKLAIFDHSCKSGASTSVFKGLGCVMTSTSAYNSTSNDFILQTFDRMRAKGGSSMADLHLDLLVNQDVTLVNIDYKDGKTVLEKIYHNTNQISGCGDEDEVHYGAFANKDEIAPQCQEYVPLFSETRDAEIETVRKVVTKLRFDGELDKQTLAKVAGVDSSKVPEASELSSKLDELIEEDKVEIDKMKPLAIEESKLMGHPDIQKSMSCEMRSGKGSRSTDYSNSTAAKNIGQTVCKALYKDARAVKTCAASSGYKRINLEIKDLFRLQREQSIYPTKRSKGYLQIEMAKSGKDHSMGAKSNISYDILKSTVKECLKKLENNGTSAQKKALTFFNKNYKKEAATCSSNTIGCHKEKAEKRAIEIKKYLSYARGYSFLSCQGKLKKPDDLKACEDFKI